MKTYLECIPCFLRQALNAGRISTKDEKVIKTLLGEVGAMIRDIPLDATPPETGDQIYRKIAEITGVEDPFREIKAASIAESLAMFPRLEELISTSPDRLQTAIMLAIAGNIIDLGVGHSFNISHDILKIVKQKPAIFDYSLFRQELAKARSVLHLGDNAGESVFDKLLIRELKKPVIFVVRDRPVINDVTRNDAIASGIPEVAEIISSGSSAPGTILNRCSPEFLDVFNNADMVISKGQGNFEGLSDTHRPVFFMLKAKCKVIADNLGVKKGDIILKAMNVVNR
jgi:uncharacterized protein with ATP-grasp and redox domains